MKNVIKILTALATVAGAIYIIATYGEQIVAWAKKMWNCLPQCPACEDEDEVVIEMTEVPAEEAAEAPAEEPAAEEVAVEEAVEEPAPEVVVADNEPVAEESDFAE